MKLARLIIGEFVLLFASIFIFRSVWTLLDQYFGGSELWLFLAVGLILTVIGLFIVNYEVKCELDKKKMS
ncbi:MAG: hypothetical protein ACQCN4_07760 [Candidatus Bathyarchaeia archaeon]|jgi:NhaP-type Na+/H+ and K+/H+ antiporter